MEQYEQCKNTNFQLVMHLGLVSTQVTALFKLLCAKNSSNPGTLWVIICWPCLMHYAVIGYLVGWHGVGQSQITEATAIGSAYMSASNEGSICMNPSWHGKGLPPDMQPSIEKWQLHN